MNGFRQGREEARARLVIEEGGQWRMGCEHAIGQLLGSRRGRDEGGGIGGLVQVGRGCSARPPGCG